MQQHPVPMVMWLALGCVAATALCSCTNSGAECRIYLVHDTSGSFDALHVVDNPNGGNWGPNLLEEPAEYLTDQPTWRVFRFDAGRIIDHRVDYTLGTTPYTLEEEMGTCDHGEGLKYEIGRGAASGVPRFFTTTFNFD